MNGDPYKQIVYSPLATPKLKGRAVPREFYPDTNRNSDVEADEGLCLDETEFWDGPGICTRPKGHKVDPIMKDGVTINGGEFHQEAFEGWVWDNDGSIW